MNRHLKFSFIALALLAVYILQETALFAAPSSSTLRLVVSRRQVKPGETVEFKLELIDARGKSQRIPRSSRPPQLVLADADGRPVATHNFAFG